MFKPVSTIACSLLTTSLILPSTAVCTVLNNSNLTEASSQPNIAITLSKQKDSAIRLEARQAPLSQILKEIASKTGVVIHYSVLPEPPVTATCVGAEVGQIMDCLVAKQVGLVAHKALKDKPAEFWLLGSSVGSCQAVTVAPAIAVVDQQPTPEEQAQADQALQEQSDQLLKQALSKDPNQRAEAIGNLGSIGAKDDPSVSEAIRTALDDKDANVRTQAINAIVQQGGDEVSSQLSQALRDKDKNVRFTAVSAVNDDVALLQQALNDSDSMIRNLAQTKLNDLTAKQVQ